MAHLVKVRSKLFVRSNRRVLQALDGEYVSRSRGRGFEFEDLREYHAGDDVRDIDWKATARREEPLVRRYLTTHQRRLVLVVDTAASMGAVTPAGESKRELAVLAGGVLGYLAVRHGDRVGLVHGDAAGRAAVRARDGERRLERLLGTVDDAVRASGAGPDLPGLISDTLRQTARDTIVVVITDDVAVDPALAAAVRRLGRSRDALWVSVADANPVPLLRDGQVGDAAGRWRLPRHLVRRTGLAEAYEEQQTALREELEALLDDATISRCRLEREDTAIRELLGMLRRRRA